MCSCVSSIQAIVCRTNEYYYYFYPFPFLFSHVFGVRYANYGWLFVIHWAFFLRICIALTWTERYLHVDQPSKNITSILFVSLIIQSFHYLCSATSTAEQMISLTCYTFITKAFFGFYLFAVEMRKLMSMISLAFKFSQHNHSIQWSSFSLSLPHFATKFAHL